MSERPFIEVLLSGPASVHLRGELDMATADELDKCLDRLARACPETIVIDLSQLTFCDSSGLNAFVSWRRRAEDAGYRLVLRSPQPNVQRIMELCNLAWLLGST